MEKEFANRSVPLLVLKLGVPSMLAQFFNILYSIVDRIFIGNMAEGGDIALAGIGICAPAVTAVTAFAAMVGIGGASCMSISMGRGDRTLAKKSIGNAFFMLLLISAAVTAAVLMLKRPLLYLLGCSDAMYPYASAYLTVYICGTPAALLCLGMNQFILAQGYAGKGMAAVVIGAICNVALDPILIYRLNMGIAGAAAATVISQTLGACFVLFTLRDKKMPVPLRFCGIDTGVIKRMLIIGAMPFFITILDNLMLILLNMQLRRYGGASGDVYLTCAAVVQSFTVLINCPGQGITNGCGTLFGFHYGAGMYKRLMRIFICVFLLCASYISILFAIAQICPEPFVRLFAKDGYIVSRSCVFISHYTLGILGVAVQFAFVDGLTAMGKIGFAMPLSLFRKGVYVFLVIVMPLIFPLETIFYVGAVSDIIGSVFTFSVFYLFISKRLRREMLSAA